VIVVTFYSSDLHGSIDSSAFRLSLCSNDSRHSFHFGDLRQFESLVNGSKFRLSRMSRCQETREKSDTNESNRDDIEAKHGQAKVRYFRVPLGTLSKHDNSFTVRRTYQISTSKK
jgi:hypothetical protein